MVFIKREYYEKEGSVYVYLVNISVYLVIYMWMSIN